MVGGGCVGGGWWVCGLWVVGGGWWMCIVCEKVYEHQRNATSHGKGVGKRRGRSILYSDRRLCSWPGAETAAKKWRGLINIHES